MKVLWESTVGLVTRKGLPAGVWRGETAQGIPCHAYITRIAVERSEDAAEFEAALRETAPLTAELAAAIPARPGLAMLPVTPEPLTAWQARYGAAVATLVGWPKHAKGLGLAQRGFCNHCSHLTDGLRLMVSRE